MSMDAANYPQQLEAAARRLQAKGLMRADDTLSCRVPGTSFCLWSTPSDDAGQRGLIELPLTASGNAAQDLHRLIYKARPDVGAVLLSRQHWASILPAAGKPMPGIFDEQLRHLGWLVRKISTPFTLEAASRELADGANAYNLDLEVMCLGMSLERVVFNAELLEKCAKAWLLASASGLPVGKIPWVVRWIATGRLKKDQKRAAEHYQRGVAPPRSAGY